MRASRGGATRSRIVWSTTLVALALCIAGCSSASPADPASTPSASTEESTAMNDEIAAAVAAAEPRFVAVKRADITWSGLARKAYVYIRVSGTQAFTRDETLRVLRAVQKTAPADVSLITLIAAESASGDPVDVRAAAEQLTPGQWTTAGAAGADFAVSELPAS